jgi:hypothetical protein
MKQKKTAECYKQGSLFATEVPVWFERSGKVSSVWFSICEEERNQTRCLTIS